MQKELRFKFTADKSEFSSTIEEAKKESDDFAKQTQATLNEYGILTIKVDTAEGTREIQAFANDTKEALDPTKFIELEDRFTKLTLATKEARGELKQMEVQFKAGVVDASQVEQAQRELNNLSKATTEAGRQLQNYKNTGDETTSRLQTKFNSVTETIQANQKQVQNLNDYLQALYKELANTDKSSADFKRLTAEVQKTTTEIEKLGTKSGSSFSTLIKGVAGVIGSYVSLRGAWNLYQEALEGNSQQQRLAELLRNTQGASDGVINSLNKQAQELENLGVLSSSVITAIQSQAATFDLSAEAIYKLTPAIADYVVAEKGINATSEDAIQLTNGLAQALNGQFGSLTRSGFVLDENTKKLISNGTEIERVTAVAEVLGTTYEDFNAKMRATPQGQLKVLQNEMSALRSEIGTGLIPIFSTFIGLINPLLTGFKKLVQEAPKLTTAIAGIGVAIAVVVGIMATPFAPIIGMVALIGTLTITIGKLINQLTGWELSFASLEKMLVVVMNVLDAFWTGLLIAVTKVHSSLLTLRANAQKIAVNFQKIWLNVSTAIAVFGNTSSAYIKQFVSNMGVHFDNAKTLLGNFVDNIGIAFGNIGAVIGKGLNLALIPVNAFFSGLAGAYNSTIAKLPGFSEWTPLEFSVDFGDVQPLKSLSEGFKDTSNSIIEEANRLNETLTQGQANQIRELESGLDSFLDGIDNQKDVIAKAGSQMASDLFDRQNQRITETTKNLEDLEGSSRDTGGELDKNVVTIGKLEEKLSDLNAQLKETEVGTEEFRRLQAEIKATEKELNSIKGTGGGKSKTAEQLAKEEEKKIKEIQKKELEEKEKNLKAYAEKLIDHQKKVIKDEYQRSKNIVEIEKNLNEELARIDIERLDDEIQKANKIVELYDEKAKKVDELASKNTSAFESIINEYDKGLDELQKYLDKIDDVNKKIEDLKNDATANIRDINHELANIGAESDEKLADRFIKIGEEIKNAENELKKLKDSGVDYWLAMSIGADTLNLIPESGTIGDNQKVSELRKVVELEQQIANLIKEQQLAQENLTEAQIEGAKVRDEMTETDKILADRKEQEEILNERLSIYKAIEEGNEITLDNIQNYENLKLAEGLLAKQEELNNELITLEQNVNDQQAILEKLYKAKEDFESKWTEYFGTEVNKQIAIQQKLQESLRRTIELQRQAGMSSGYAGDYSDNRLDEVNKNLEGINQDNRTFNIEMNNNNIVDYDIAFRELNNLIE